MKNSFLTYSLLIILLISSSCARKISFLTSAAVPAARGNVKLTKDNNHNYAIDIHLSNLAEVSRLQPSKLTYVIWMETEKGVKNIGQIKSSSNMIRKNLKANFHSVSSLKPTKIFLTAEDDADIQYPGIQLIISTDSF